MASNPLFADQAKCTHQTWVPYEFWAAFPPVGNVAKCTKLLCPKCGMVLQKNKDGVWIQIVE